MPNKGHPPRYESTVLTWFTGAGGTQSHTASDESWLLVPVTIGRVGLFKHSAVEDRGGVDLLPPRDTVAQGHRDTETQGQRMLYCIPYIPLCVAVTTLSLHPCVAR